MNYSQVKYGQPCTRHMGPRSKNKPNKKNNTKHYKEFVTIFTFRIVRVFLFLRSALARGFFSATSP